MCIAPVIPALLTVQSRRASLRIVTPPQILELGFHVLHCDIDSVWLRDPLPYLQRLVPPGAPPDFVVSSDKVSTESPRDALEGFEMGANPHTNINTGVYLVRNTPGALRLILCCTLFFELSLKRCNRCRRGCAQWRRDGTVHLHGLTHASPRPAGGLRLMRAWHALRDRNMGNDQDALYNYLRAPPGDTSHAGADPPGVFRVQSNVSVGVLSVALMMNGAC